jgi:hypothetical protein
VNTLVGKRLRYPYDKMIELGMMGGGQYYQKVKSTYPIMCMPLWDETGTSAIDIGLSGNGIYTGVDLAIDPFEKRKAPYFDGVSDYVTIKTAGLVSRINGQVGSAMIWARPFDASVLTDTKNHVLMYLQSDSNNRINISKTTVSNQYTAYRAGAGTFSQRYFNNTSLLWSNYLITWSKTADQVCVYLNNVLQGGVLTGLGDYSGALSSGFVGCEVNTPTKQYHGYLAYATIWDRALTEEDRWIVTNP